MKNSKWKMKNSKWKNDQIRFHEALWNIENGTRKGAGRMKSLFVLERLFCRNFWQLKIAQSVIGVLRVENAPVTKLLDILTTKYGFQKIE